MSRDDQQLLWFHGKLARDHAESLLRDETAADGTFLVRESHTSDGDYVLSVRCSAEVYHYQIRRHGEDAFFSIDEQQPLHGLDTLIEHYRRTGADNGLAVPLGRFVRGAAPPPDSRSHGRTNLLHRATREGDLTVVSELLKCGYRNIDAKNQDGETAVHLATRRGGPLGEQIVAKLLENGANVGCRDSRGNTALHYASQTGAVAIMYQLIEAKAYIQARNNETGCVPLHEAARHGQLDAVRVLLQCGAPHLPRTVSGELPVDFAREGAHRECAEYLEHYRPPDACTFRYQWYHGTLDRGESTAILREYAREMCDESRTAEADDGANGAVSPADGAPDAPIDVNRSSGVFLVRISAKTNDYILTLLYENQPKNFIIQKYMKCLYIDEGPYMLTLEHLIEHYQRFSDGLPINLRHPVPPQPKPPLPLFSTIPKSARVKHVPVAALPTIDPASQPHSAKRNLSIPSDALMNTHGVSSPLVSPTQPTKGAVRSTASDILNFRSLKLKSPRKNIIIDGVKSLKKARKTKKVADEASATAVGTPSAIAELSMSLRNLTFSADLKPIDIGANSTPDGCDVYNVPMNNGAVQLGANAGNEVPDNSNSMAYFTESDFRQVNARAKDSEDIYFIDAPPAVTGEAADVQPPAIAYTPFTMVPNFSVDPPAAVDATPAAAAPPPPRFDRLESHVSLTSTASDRFFRQQLSTDHTHPLAGSGPNKPEYFIPAEALQQQTVLGEGEFGSVYAGTYRWSGATNNNADDGRIAVAIKTLHDEHCKQNRVEFLREASVMIKLSHHCIVRLIGISKGPPLMMVQELVALGSMLSYLLEHSDQIGVHFELKLWAAQIACGMDFLESHHFVHRDLAARNILLASRNQAKISDFGLSRALASDRNYYQASQGGKWPIKWYAPESFNYGTFSHASDVWSFGVTLWEMFAYGQVPYGDLKGVDVIRLVEAGERLARTSRCPDSVYACMERCWNYNPKDRPTFRYLMTFFASDPDYQNVVEMVPTTQIG